MTDELDKALDSLNSEPMPTSDDGNYAWTRAAIAAVGLLVSRVKRLEGNAAVTAMLEPRPDAAAHRLSYDEVREALVRAEDARRRAAYPAQPPRLAMKAREVASAMADEFAKQPADVQERVLANWGATGWAHHGSEVVIDVDWAINPKAATSMAAELIVQEHNELVDKYNRLLARLAPIHPRPSPVDVRKIECQHCHRMTIVPPEPLSRTGDEAEVVAKLMAPSEDTGGGRLDPPGARTAIGLTAEERREVHDFDTEFRESNDPIIAAVGAFVRMCGGRFDFDDHHETRQMLNLYRAVAAARPAPVEEDSEGDDDYEYLPDCTKPQPSPEGERENCPKCFAPMMLVVDLWRCPADHGPFTRQYMADLKAQLPSPPQAEEWDSVANWPPIDVTVVVSGQAHTAPIRAEHIISDFVAKVLRETGNIGQPPDQWELRRKDGEVIDQRLPGLMLVKGETLFLVPRAGVGGAPQAEEAGDSVEYTKAIANLAQRIWYIRTTQRSRVYCDRSAAEYGRMIADAVRPRAIDAGRLADEMRKELSAICALYPQKAHLLEVARRALASIQGGAGKEGGK